MAEVAGQGNGGGLRLAAGAAEVARIGRVPRGNGRFGVIVQRRRDVGAVALQDSGRRIERARNILSSLRRRRGPYAL